MLQEMASQDYSQTGRWVFLSSQPNWDWHSPPLAYLLLFSTPGFAPGDKFEQHFALVKNPRGRRASFSHSAFPELHRKVSAVG